MLSTKIPEEIRADVCPSRKPRGNEDPVQESRESRWTIEAGIPQMIQISSPYAPRMARADARLPRRW